MLEDVYRLIVVTFKRSPAGVPFPGTLDVVVASENSSGTISVFDSIEPQEEPANAFGSRVVVPQLAPMFEQVEKNTGTKPAAGSADNGYWAPGQIADKRVEGIDLHVATGRDKHGASEENAAAADPAKAATEREQMKQKLQTDEGRAIYKMRKAIVEPVFGQIKECRNFRRFSLRGVKNIKAEWKLVCLTHNILKLFRYGGEFQAASA